MRYVYVDESGSLNPGVTTTWVLARYVDPFAASQFVDAEWRRGAKLLNDLRRLLQATVAVASMAAQPKADTHLEWRTIDRLIKAAGSNPHAECHANDVFRVVRQLNAWVDPSQPVVSSPQLPAHSRIGMDLACQESVSGNLLAPLAQAIASGVPITGGKTQLAALGATRDRIVEVNGPPVDAVQRFDLVLRCIGHGVFDAFTRVLDVGLRSADRIVVVQVHGDAGIAPNRTVIATQAITSACRHLLGGRPRRRQATVLVDGEFPDGMKMTADLTCPDGLPLVTGVVPVNSQGTPLIWVSDGAANLLNRPDEANAVKTRLRASILRRVHPRDMVEIRTVADWQAFTRVTPGGRPDRAGATVPQAANG